MSPVSRAEAPEVLPDLQQEIARLAGLPEIRQALAWLRLQEARLAGWQLEMARIAAPPFGESTRGQWLAQKFRELGLQDVHSDEVGNVFGVCPASGKDYVGLSA
ncbi:MAG TPA: peptidase M20, partial [Terriglobales bacterium]|nr:peptidase M20 [Terriglobales bacterium]